MSPKKIFAELQRRNVYKVAVAYAVVSWLLIQIATQVFPVFEVPNWAARLVVIFLLLGFPVALVLAWAYELTPAGIQRTEEVDPRKSVLQRTGRKLDFIIIAVLLAVIGVMVWQHYRSPRTGGLTALAEKSIAILPFLDFSPGKDQEYFTDGITEQMINSLAHVHGLLVLARTTAFAFKNKNIDIREIGRQLHVTHVLEGSVTQGAGKIRVVAQLIDVANGYHLWSETYDSSETDLLSLQSDVAKKVANALKIQLHLADAQQIDKTATHNQEAYDLYLRGRYLLNKRTVDSVQKAREFFAQAIAKDAQFALGHAGVADSYILLGKLGAMRGEDAAAQAWPKVTAALALDDQLAEGYVSRGVLLTDFEWDWPAAEADYRKALALSPSSAAAHLWYARHLAEIGRAEDAAREILAAQKQDPLSPTIWASKAKILFVNQKSAEAIEACQHALELEPGFAAAFSVRAQAQAARGEFPQAIDAAKKFVELSGYSGFAKLELAYAYAMAGDRAECERIVNEVTKMPGQFSPYDMATICAALRDNAGALRWLEQALAQRSVDVVWIRVDPRLQNVRTAPGFGAVLAKMVPRR